MTSFGERERLAIANFSGQMQKHARMSAESFGGGTERASDALPEKSGSLARRRISAQPLFYVHDVFARRFVDRADNGARDRELDHGACDPAGQDFER